MDGLPSLWSGSGNPDGTGFGDGFPYGLITGDGTGGRQWPPADRPRRQEDGHPGGWAASLWDDFYIGYVPITDLERYLSNHQSNTYEIR